MEMMNFQILHGIIYDDMIYDIAMAYGLMQWAAVRTWVSEMRVAPQYWPEPRPSLCTCIRIIRIWKKFDHDHDNDH